MRLNSFQLYLFLLSKYDLYGNSTNRFNNFCNVRIKVSASLIPKFFNMFGLEVANRVQFQSTKVFHFDYDEFDLTNFNRNHSQLLNSNNQSFIKSASCPLLTCQPGFHEKYGNVSNGYAWKCESCPVNHYKSVYGNTACEPCSGKLSVNNGDRTRCLDPYTDLPLQFSSEKIFVISICCVGMIGTLLTLLVFLRQKNSPIVSLSDFKLSVGHMMLMVFIFGAVMFSMLWQQNYIYHICVAKVLFVSIAYVFNVASCRYRFHQIAKVVTSFSEQDSSNKWGDQTNHCNPNLCRHFISHHR